MQILKNNKKKFLIVGVLLFVLLLIRAFENDLFYDPFIAFFQDDYQNKALPKFDSLQLFLGLFFRFFINSLVSILIIYFLFKDMALVKLTTILLVVFFIVLIVILFTILNYSSQPDYLFLFYIRRFLIQPLFLILFVPAFLYQKSVNN